MAKDKTAIVSGAGWIGGFVDQLVREMLAQGWTYDDIHALVSQTRPEDQPIKAIVAGMRKSFPSSAIATKYGYEVVGDVKKPSQFRVKDLEFVGFLEPGEQSVNGEVMCSRAVTHKANLGLVDGEYMLDHQDEIPVEMCGKCIVLAGTKLRGCHGVLCVACLHWIGEQWYLDFCRLAYDWDEHNRFPRCKSAAQAA